MDSSRPQQATVVCTLGMHRSGTSVTSRMLNLLGVHLGSDDRLLTSGQDNPKGYWEYRPFVDINDEILFRFGGQWDEPPVFPPQWPHDSRLGDLRERARHLLTEDAATAPLWGWKDPRTCLTLPFWQDLIGPMRYVVCTRNPGAVVASLASRDGMSDEKAERLWLAYMQALLSHTGGQLRLFVSYEDVIDDWSRELRRLAAFIGVPERVHDPQVQEAVGQFLENELCHHRMSLEDLANNQQVSFPTKSLYLAVMSHDESAGDMLVLLGTRALEAWDRTVAVATERNRLAAEVGTLGEQAVAISATCQDLTARVDTQARELQDIRSSCAWKLVTFSRSKIAGLLPVGTRRRRFFNTLLHRIARRSDIALRTV